MERLCAPLALNPRATASMQTSTPPLRPWFDSPSGRSVTPFGACRQLLRRGGLEAFEMVSVVVFTVEYAPRLRSCTVDPHFAHRG